MLGKVLIALMSLIVCMILLWLLSGAPGNFDDDDFLLLYSATQQ